MRSSRRATPKRTRVRKQGNATLEELERNKWGEPEYRSHVVTECHRLRRVQLRLLTVENLRLLIGQNIGLTFLIPIALERLREDPLVEGDFFPGDLLSAVLRSNRSYWAENAKEREAVVAIIERARSAAASQGKIVKRALEESITAFAEQCRACSTLKCNTRA